MSQSMMESVVLESVLPHRGINLLPDTVLVSDDRQRSVSRTQVGEQDDRERRRLGRLDEAGELCWYEPFLGELLALSSVPLISERLKAAGKEAVFSAISRVSIDKRPWRGVELGGEVQITRDRGSFTQVDAELTQNGERVFFCEIMCGSAVLSDITAQPVQAFGEPAAGEAAPGELFDWKDPALRFVDSVEQWDAEQGRIVARYHYPEQHLFVPTHFPDAALMMGVTQWAAVADAAWIAAQRLGLDALRCNGVLKREDGSEIVAVRDLEMQSVAGQPHIRSTKRVAFKEPVRPGDDMLIDVQVEPC